MRKHHPFGVTVLACTGLLNESGGPLANALLQQPIKYEAGHLAVPDGPGLGIAFEDAALKEHVLDPYEPI